MFKKLGIASAMLCAALIAATQLYDFTARPAFNERVLVHQSVVDRLGDSAPLQSRIVARLSSLPQDIINLIAPPAGAQTVPQQRCINCNMSGHVTHSQQSKPTVAGATITSGSTDFRGEFSAVTGASGGAVTVTFGAAFLSAPVCTVSRSDGGSTVFLSYTVSTTALTFAGLTSGAGVKVNWICLGVMQ